MASTPRRSSRFAKGMLGLAVGFAILPETGCGDDPINQAGTIELPERKIAPPPDARSFAKDKANPKNPNP